MITDWLTPQSYTPEGRLWCSTDSFQCQHLYIWFGVKSRVCICPHKFIILILCDLFSYPQSIDAIGSKNEILSYLLHEDHGKAVDLYGHDSCQESQGGVCQDRDEWEIRDTDEDAEDRSEHATRGCGVVPVYQLFGGLLQIN